MSQPIRGPLHLPALRACLGIVLVAASCVALGQSRPIRIDFEGIGELAQPRDFYRGGGDSAGNGGPDFGVEFAYGLVQFDTTPGCCGAPVVAGRPAGHAVLNLAVNGSEVVLNVARGFSTGLSFWYSANGSPVTIEVYEREQAGGQLLKSVTILANQKGSTAAIYGTWTRLGLEFEGVARSVALSGRQANFAIDDLVLGEP